MHYILCGKNENRDGSSFSITNYQGMDYSSVYDFSYYISKYADLKEIYGNDETGAFKHFISFGMKEGRQAISSFNVDAYKERYTDLQNALGGDLPSYYLHYITTGKNEGRDASELIAFYDGIDYSSVYDYSYYLAKYADLRSVFGPNAQAVFRHFLDSGMNEGRQASSEFNIWIYNLDFQ